MARSAERHYVDDLGCHQSLITGVRRHAALLFAPRRGASLVSEAAIRCPDRPACRNALETLCACRHTPTSGARAISASPSAILDCADCRSVAGREAGADKSLACLPARRSRDQHVCANISRASRVAASMLAHRPGAAVTISISTCRVTIRPLSARGRQSPTHRRSPTRAPSWRSIAHPPGRLNIALPIPDHDRPSRANRVCQHRVCARCATGGLFQLSMPQFALQARLASCSALALGARRTRVAGRASLIFPRPEGTSRRSVILSSANGLSRCAGKRRAVRIRNYAWHSLWSLDGQAGTCRPGRDTELQLTAALGNPDDPAGGYLDHTTTPARPRTRPRSRHLPL